MDPRELILLSPYRVPAQHSQMLGNEDTAAFLNAYTALWHPAALHGAAAPPRIASPYDHEQPTAGHIYAVPESPPLILPDDWDQRVIDARAIVFRATADRETTLANLKEALRTRANESEPNALLDVLPDRIVPFFGIGFGYVMVEALFEAMEHENLLATNDLWQDVQSAVAALNDPDHEVFHRHLQLAADRLMSAREVLYPVTIHVLDLCLLDESRLAEPLPAAFDKNMPINLVACASILAKLGQEQPERLAAIRERLQSEQLEVCGGPYLEREDALLPVESQLWNLTKGQAAYRELLGTEVRVFARKRFAFHPQMPLLLQNIGTQRAVLLAFDASAVPTYRSTTINWPSPDGKQVEAFTRTPHSADNPQTYFHLAHYLHQTIREDHAATLALLHSGTPAGPWYDDWLELSRFGPVLGQRTTLSRYFNDVTAGEYASTPSADEFHGDYLEERTNAHDEQPVSWFARHVRLRRRIDAAWTLAALHRGLAGRNDAFANSQYSISTRLAELEDKIEGGINPDPALTQVEKELASALANRLVARAAAEQPGYMLLNPCSFTRRVALELDGIAGPLPIEGRLKAAQFDGDKARLVVEVPALGFAWVPQAGPPGTPPPSLRMKLADKNTVRNEFFEADIDPLTGGLRALRDHRTRINRIGQQLVYNPGSTMRLSDMKVTSNGPALGELVTEGALLDEQEQVLATFRQRFRTWLGRPVLDLRIEIYPQHQPEGYPWHAYYGARFAWRDERATLLRGVNGSSSITTHTRPESPEYLELRHGNQSTVLFPGGLPFHQRQGTRMLDVILVPEGETVTTFDLALALDREHPAQTALGMVTPAPLMPTAKGPPHIGAAGWLFHLDAPNLILTSLRPAADGADAILARLLECSTFGGHTEFRCVRDPRRAILLDANGSSLLEATTSNDAAIFDVSPGDFLQLRVEFE